MLLAAVALQTAVSFAAPADTAARLLPKLGAAMGLRLETDRKAGGEVLLIRVQAADRVRLLERVATAVGGKWEPINGGYRLTLDGLALAELRKAESRARSNWLPSAKARLSRKGGDDALLVRALDTLPVEALARIGVGERVVWSNAPTSLQKALPGKAFEIGRELAGTYRKKVEEIARRPGVMVDSETLARLADPVRTVLLTARRGTEADSVGASLRAFDGNGRLMVSVEAVLPSPPATSLDVSDVPVSLPDEMTKWAKAAREGSASTALAEKIFRPAEHEPIAIGVGPAVELLASSLGKDVVAVLPDSAYASLAVEIEKMKRLPDLAKAMALSGLNCRIDSEGLLATPISPAATVERRADRRELARLLRSRAINGGFASDDLVRPGMVWALLRTLTPIDASTEEEELQMLPIKAAWNTLSPREKASAFDTGLAMNAVNSGFWRGLLLANVRPWAESEGRGVGSMLALEPTGGILSIQMQGTLIAKMREEPFALFQRETDQLCNANAMWSVAHGILTDPTMRSSGTRFWPAVNRQVSLDVSYSSGTLIRLTTSLQETRRAVDRETFYPTLFPALRQEVERARGGR